MLLLLLLCILKARGSTLNLRWLHVMPLKQITVPVGVGWGLCCNM